MDKQNESTGAISVPQYSESTTTVTGLSAAPVSSASSQGPPGRFRGRDQWRRITGALIALVIFVGGAYIWLTRDEYRLDNSASLQPAASYDIQQIPLDTFTGADLAELNTTQSLSINGQLRTNGSLILTPGAKPKDAVKGQIYYDTATNTPYIYNGESFVSLSVADAVQSIGGQTGSIALGPGLQLSNGQLSLDGGVLSVANTARNGTVTSIQGRTGAVAFSTGSGIAISGTTITNTGVVSIPAASPQLAVTQGANGAYTIGIAGNVATATGSTGQVAVFDSANNLVDSLIGQVGTMVGVSGDMNVSGQLQVNTITSLTPGTEFTVSAGNDQLVFVSGGRSFQLPSAGAATQTICTVGMDCSTGGGGTVLVQLQPGAVQNDTGAGASLFINNTGGGDLLRLQGNGLDAFVVDNAGNTTISGNLSVIGAINGATVNNANINGGNITGANINNASITGGSLTNTTVNGLTVTSTTVSSVGALNINAGNNSNLNLNTSGTGIIALGTAMLQGSGALTLSAGGTDQNLTLTGTGLGNVIVQTPIFHNANGASYAFDPADSGATSAVICTSVGNCSGSGIAGGGTAGTIAVWTGSGTTIGDSILSQSAGALTVTGDLTANNLQGNGSGLTNVDAVSLNGQTDTFYRNASNLNTGTISDLRLSSNIVKYSDTTANFTGALQQNGNDVCTTAGNCSGSSGVGGSGTNGTIALWTGTGFDLTNSALTQSAGNLNASGSLSVVGAISGASLSVSGSAAAGSLSLAGILNGTAATFSGNVSGADAVNSNEFVTKSQLDGAIGGVAGGVASLNTLSGDLIIQGTTGQISVASNGTDTLTLSLDGAVTLQGNIVNAANGLVKLDGSGHLPALNGSALTNLNGTALTTGTVADARLSANVALLGSSANFTGSNLRFGGYDVCTKAGNCIGSPGGAVSSDGTSGHVALFNADGYHLADSYLLQGTGMLTVESGADLVLAGGDLNVSGSGAFTGTVSGANAVSSSDFVTLNQLNGAIGGVGGGVSSINTLSGDLTMQGTAGQVVITPSGGNTFTFSLGANVTVQGNTFNGAGQLVQLNGSTQLPGVDGSLLTSVNAATLQGQNGAYYLNLANATGSLAIARIVDGSLTNVKLQNSSLSVTAGTGLSGGGSVALGGSATLNLANTAVTAGSYGSATNVGSFTVDQQGRLTAAASVPIAIDASQITSGTIAGVRVSGSYTGITGTGALAAGSLTTGFGTINIGSNITTTGMLAGSTMNATSGTIQTAGMTRIDNGGALQNVTGISQTSGNFSQGGTGTFSTASGAVFLNGATAINSTLNVSGATTFENYLTINGAQFTNNGSTLNTALSLGNFATGGSVGTASATVDSRSSIAIAQTTAGQTLTLPAPTNATAGRVIYIFNTGTTSFTMGGISVANGYGQIFLWNGTAWILGANGGGGSVTLQGAYDGGNTLNTTNARDIAFTLTDTTTDANFRINVASGSTSQLKVQNNGTDVMAIGSAGQLALAVQGAAGGIAIGGDTLAYRSGANRLQMNNALALRNATDTSTALQVQTAAGADVFTVNTASSRVAIGTGAGSTAKLHVNGGISVWSPYAATQANSWSAVTYGNGLFVAVSSDGTNRVMTSPDGTTWTARSAAAANPWTSVTYGNGLFVAVSSTGTNRVMTSPDGITWSVRNASEPNSWTSITYGNGLFVAISQDGTNRVMTSPDGITWTARSAAAINTWKSITYGNGLFVAISQDGTNRVMTSPDGITWSVRNASEPNSWTSITYGNGLFVAISQDGTNRVMTSPDGITWTARAAVETNTWTSITYGNGLFVAVALFGVSNQIMTSPDGITWTTQASTEPNAWSSVAYGNGRFVAVASSGTNRVMISNGSTAMRTEGSIEITNGRISTRGSNDGAVQIQDAAGENVLRVDTVSKGIVIGGYDGSAQAQLQIASQESWISRTATEANSWNSVTYGNGLFVAVSSSGTNRVMTSPDGITWTARASTEANSWNSVTYGNGLFVAVALNGTNRVMTSPDGITWTPVLVQSSNWYGITFGNGLFVAVTSGGTNRVMTSPDGITWTARATPTVNMVNVTHGNGRFVAVANSGTDRIATSPDGINWTARSAPEANNWNSVTYGNGRFVAVASTGNLRVMSSANGITWTTQTSPEQNSWNGVVYGNGRFAAVSSSGTNRVMTLQPSTTPAMLVQDAIGADVLSLSSVTRTLSVANLTVGAHGALTVTGGDSSTRPTNPSEGTIYFDTTAKRLIYYADGQWKSASQVNNVVTVATQTSKGKDGADFVVSAADEAAGNADATIATAIAALPAGGGTVYLMDGTYTLDTSIYIPSNTTFAGSGRNSTILKLKSGHNASINILNIENGFTYHNNVTIKDLGIDGNKANQTAGTQHGIHTYRMGNQTSSLVGITVNNVYVKDMRNHGMYIEQTANSKISDSYFMTNGGAGIYTNGTNSRNSYVNNTARDNTGIGIDVEGDHEIVANNHIQGNSSHGIDANGSSVKVTDNTVTNNGGIGINSTNIDAVISGNKVSSNTSNGMYIDERAIVTSNNIQSNGASGIYSQYLDNTATISNNIIRANAGSGIEFNRGGANSSITGNTIESNTAAGIQIYGYLYQIETGLAIGSNYIGSNATYGIYLSSVAHSSVTGNTVVNNGGTTTNNGIYLNNNYSGIVNITGNTITDTSCTTSCNAITVAGRDNVLSGNTIGDSTLNDIGSNLYGQGEILDNGTNTNYVNQRDGNGNLINRSSGGFGVNTKTVTSSLTLQGGIMNSQLPTPGQPSVARVGAAGTTTYGYRVSALDGTGETLASTERTITNAFATLDGTNYNVITWAEVPGAVQYRVYRTTSAGTPASMGLIATVTGGSAITVNDTGLAATTAVPSTNTTGGASIAGTIQGSSANLTSTLTVAGATTLNGTLTATGTALFKNASNSATAFQIQDSSSTPLLVADTSTKLLTVRSLAVTYNLTVNGHIISGGGTPTAVAGSAACTSPTVTVSGTDTAGTITVETGSACLPGQLVFFTYSTAFAKAPSVTITPANSAATTRPTFVDSSTAGFELLVTNTADVFPETYKWYYQVIE